MSNNSSFVFSNGLNIKVTGETKYNNLYDEIDNKAESLNGIFPVISINSNVYADSSVLSGAENLILANTSKVTFINTDIKSGNTYSVFADNNSQIFTDFTSNLSSIKSVKSLGNNLINFPLLTVKNTKILQPQIETNYIYQDNNWKPITICVDVFNDFYPNNQHLTSTDLILSPKFLNNGDIAFWGMNQNQRVLNDIVISGTTYNQIINIINNLPKDLNGHKLTTDFSKINSAISGTFELSGFFGGEIEVIGNDKTIFSTKISNCDNVIFKKWYCGSLSGSPALTLINSKNISFENSSFKDIKYLDKVKCFEFDNSSVYINSSKFIFAESQISEYFKGKAINNSQVFIDGLCSTYVKETNGTEKLASAVCEFFPKFQLSDNSMCTWLDDSIPVAKLGLYSQSEFKGITTGLTEDVFIGNHLHQNVPPQFLPSTGTTGGSSSGGSTGGSGGSSSGGSSSGSGSDPLEELYTIDNTLPVGAAFYWPRAFTIPFKEVSEISKANTLSGSKYFFYPPDTEITSEYQKSASSVLIPFMTRSNSFR